jgi:hypothetical protein
MENKNMKLNNAPGMLAAILFLLSILYTVHSEWMAFLWNTEGDFNASAYNNMMITIIIIIFSFLSLLLCVIFLVKKLFRKSILCFFVAFSPILFIFVSSKIKENLMIYVFYQQPDFCPSKKEYPGGMEICIEYHGDLSSETIMMDKTNKIDAPFNLYYLDWPTDKKLLMFRAIFNRDPQESSAYLINDCSLIYTKRIIGNVYVRSGSGYRVGCD